MSEKTHKGKDSKKLSRRRLLKGAAVGGVAIGTTGLLSKAVVSNLSKLHSGQAQRAYLLDVVTGDKALMSRGYEPVSIEEITELIKFFERSYRKFA